MKMKKMLLLIAFLNALFLIKAQNLLTYAGNSARESFNDVIQLSNGDILVCGSAENSTWISASVPQTELTNYSGIANATGGGDIAFLLLFDSTATVMKHVVYLPIGVAENFRMIKTSNIPLQATGEMFVSGRNDDLASNEGGYFIGKLNNNFVDGIPTGFVWVKSIWAEGEVKNNPPWDVNNLGEVTYMRGQATANDWGCVHRLDVNGQRKYVEGWRTHWKTDGSEYKGFGAEYTGPVSELSYSGIVMKAGGRCDLRSTSAADYDLTMPDGNGGTRKGKWPMDFLFNSPCNVAAVSTTGPGYNGYRIGGSSVYGTSAIAIDKRTNDLYLGWNTKSILPDGLPDFEPAVMKMNQNGDMQWWSRLYHEIQPSGDTMLSTPDQFIDGLAVDYSVSGVNSKVVVVARCHGNNVENFWEGNTIAANPSAVGFQRQFTGSSGTPHFTWIGKFMCADGTLMHSTYMGEYTEGYSGGTPFPAGHPLAGWPNPNTGWAQLNDTRTVRNTTKVSADGSVCVIATGRRTMTTSDAYFPNLIPGTGTGSWNSFVRVYSSDLNNLEYSSIVDAPWTATGTMGQVSKLQGVFKTNKGLIIVGNHKENGTTGTHFGNPMNTIAVPVWGQSAPSNQSAFLAYYQASSITNPEDNVIPVPVGNQAPIANNNSVSTNENTPIVFPNIISDDTDDSPLNFSNIDLDITTSGVQSTAISSAGTWTLNVATGEVTFVPLSTFIGTTTLTYEICDNGTPSLCDQATLSVDVIDVNTAPFLNNNSTSTLMDVAVVIATILSNDVDDLPLTTSMIDLDLVIPGIQTNIITFEGEWTLDLSNGDVTFSPNTGFVGTASIIYEVCDAGIPQLCAQATLTVLVDNPSVNDSPIANNNSASTQENTSVTILNIIGDDTDDSPLTTAMIDMDITLLGVQTSITTAEGVWSLDLTTGNVTFEPLIGFTGSAVLTYEICDNGTPQLCDQGILTVDVTLSLEEWLKNQITIYPNPSENIVNISLEGDANYRLIESSGKLICSATFKHNCLIDISNLASSVYILEINKGQQTIRKQITKM
jgi:hypothetical protein